jgi:hypothetical protein
MDPNACLQRYRDAMEDGEIDEARDAAEDLGQWLRMGGFEPDWKEGERALFAGSIRHGERA